MMDFTKKVVVSGKIATINQYTEKRAKRLLEIQQEIEQFIKDNPEKTVGEIAEQKAEWYRKKAEVLWTFDTPVDKSFYASEDFEVSVLQQSEAFFLSFANYL
jgi:hypothetical protein